MKHALRNKILLVLTVLVAVVVAIRFNLRIFYVSTGSMGQVLPPCSVVFVIKPMNPSYALGTVIAFVNKSHQRVIIHRILNYVNDSYITKGDSNNFNDREETFKSSVLGKALCVIPFGTTLYFFIQTGFVLVSFVLGILIRSFLVFLNKYVCICPAPTSNKIY